MRSGIARKSQREITGCTGAGTGTRGRSEESSRPAAPMPCIVSARTGLATRIKSMNGTWRWAREAMSNGDRIEAENFYQHAEHYFRVMRDRTN